MSRDFRVTIGTTFNELIILEYIGLNKAKQRLWKCQCSCGNITKVTTCDLRSGKTKSCGCLQRRRSSEFNFKHGLTRSLEYRTWCNIKNRCYNPNNKDYHNYGGRGIYVCDTWINSFETFIQDMGRKSFKGATLDRIDNNGPYSPDNCRWASQTEQARNRSNNHLITFNGKTQCLAAWAEELNLKYHTLKCRILYYGWSIEKAFTMPLRG